MKKIFFLILAFSFLVYSTGCTSMGVVPKEEALIIVYPLEDLEILTNKNESYYFKGGEFIFSKNSLIGKGIQYSNDDNIEFSGSISFEDIIETKRPVTDWVKTSIFLGASALIVIAAIIILPELSYGPMGGGYLGGGGDYHWVW